MTWSSKYFYAQYPKPGPDRDGAVVHEVIKGNVPSWMFQFVPIKIDDETIEVAPDYLSIGTDQDFVRTPLTPKTAQFLADHFGYKLPTTQLVDAIYEQAEIRLKPQPTDWYKNGDDMRLGLNYWHHSEMIETQLRMMSPGKLIAGHKKDVVSTPALEQNPKHVAIYGWHQSIGHPIQPLFLGHDLDYEDYSHGIRFVKTDNPAFAGKCCLDSSMTEEK